MTADEHRDLRERIEALEKLTRQPGPWPAMQYEAVGVVIEQVAAFIGLRFPTR